MMSIMTKADRAALSRRRFLQGGALVVSFALLPNLPFAQQAQQGRRLPGNLNAAPSLDSWIRINADGTVTMFTGKVELGQGIKTALAQIVAEELDVPLARITVITGDTAVTPNEGGTVGSQSVEGSGAALRQASADVRLILLERAAERLKTGIADLDVVEGVVVAKTGGRVAYAQLVEGDTLKRNADGRGRPKPPSAHKVVGTSAPRLDIPAKVFGGAAYVQDMRLPGMLHARVVRPPSYGATLNAVDEAAVRAMPGVVRVVRDGSFLGVVAEREEQAIRAMERLRETARWSETAKMPAQNKLYDYLTTSKTQDALIVNGAASQDPIPPLATPSDGQTLRAVYHKPYFMHGAIGPSAAVAQLQDGKVTVWTHSQTIFNLQDVIAQVLRMEKADVRCIHAENAGCYGHNGADDAGLDAALLARAVPGRPVKLQWTRADEHAWEPYGSAQVMQMQATLDASGSVTAWSHEVYSTSHNTRPRGQGRNTELVAGWSLAEPFPRAQARPSGGSHSGEFRNADPLYAFPNKRVVSKFVPEMPLRVSATRALGAWGNVFAIESFMDELAVAARMDPVEFRLKHLKDERARAVIRAAAEKANWRPGPPVRGDGKGRGFAFAQYKNVMGYTAIVVDLEVDRGTGDIRMTKAVIAGDSGQIINPDGLINQLEGGFIQSASWTLKEQVTFADGRVTSTDWASYPILTFEEIPEIETVLLSHPDQRPLGSGEVTQGPASAAIANAVYNAIGVRLREAPFTPERVRAARPV